MKSKINCCFFILLWFVTPIVFAQKGAHYITNFSPSDYGASDQNWGSIQDEWGRIFVANNDGVFLNDGKSWIPIFLRNQSRSVSINKGLDNKIYVGGEGEFGYLDNKPNGEIVYKSLSILLPTNDGAFGCIWATICINDEIFFGSNEKLFWYKNGVVKVFAPEKEVFHTFFKVGNHLFVREKQEGFKVFANGKLVKVEDSEIFANERVDFILQDKENNYWVGARNLGVYKMTYNSTAPEKSVFVKEKSMADGWMKENELYCGAKINENMYALGSLKGGILLVDKNFNILDRINYEKGLLDDGVKNIFVDWNENIWLSLNFGISYVELNTPITRWTAANGLKGIIESSIKFNSKLYVATDKGLQVLDNNTNRFRDTDIGDQAFGLIIKNKDLLVATAVGLYKVSAEKISLIYEASVYSLYSDPGDSKTVYLGTDAGLVVGEYSNGEFKESKYFNNWGDVRSIAIDKNGRVGAGTSHNGAFISAPGKLEFTHIANKQGLAVTSEIFIFTYRGNFLIAGDTGLYEIKDFDNYNCFRLKEIDTLSDGIFKVPISRAAQIGDDIWLQYVGKDENMIKKDLLASITMRNGEFNVNRKMLHRIKNINAKAFFSDSNNIYISTNAGLYCYDVSVSPKQSNFYTFISKVEFKNDTTRLLTNFTGEEKLESMEVPFMFNEISIVPSASDYYDNDELRYSYYLEGKEDDFGKWTKVSKINYNNLHEGNYVFHLKSQNIMGSEGKEISISFTILPPWYRAVWAYMLYVLGFVLVVWLIVKWNSKRLVEQNIRLENTITERTKTIVKQKAEIEIKKQEITDSINYAKRIQDSILPSIKEIKKTWNDVFVFFQPKDIVSGDFYWYNKINENEFLIAVADCTGHGVPGGFMSMICSDKLNDAVSHTKNPAEILFRTNNAIKFALRSDDDESKDGMEILLLKVNTQTRKIYFAGANLTLMINRQGASEIESIRSTKASVGSITPHDFEYELFELELSKGDQLYFSSDGYADQFGGPDGKKYLSKSLKNYIFSIKKEPFQKQQELLTDNIHNWMQGHEQVDDLLMIGIRL